jgi:hypothetical protein
MGAKGKGDEPEEREMRVANGSNSVLTNINNSRDLPNAVGRSSQLS